MIGWYFDNKYLKVQKNPDVYAIANNLIGIQVNHTYSILNGIYLF